MSYADTLRQASWRGVPFGMLSSAAALGRRKVEHDYPYRDTVWLEDQGKLPRRFKLTGFLVGTSAVYGGGDIPSQLKRMEGAAEQTGQGILVHPTRGRLTVDLLDLTLTERWDEGNYVELEFTFVRGGSQLFPSILSDLSGLVGQVTGLADAAGLGDFVSSVTGPLQQGLDAATSMATTAQEWVDRVQTLANDATSLYDTVSQLGGSDFGRYFHGANSGFLAGLSSPYDAATSVNDLITLGATQRAAVAAAAATLQSAIGAIGAGSTPADVATAAQATVAALQGSAADPADGVRLLASLATFTPISNAATTVSGVATSTLFVRAAAAAVARVSATYAPSSADDAKSVQAIVLGPVEAQIRVAGDSGADDVFSALRQVRAAVVNDLGARGAALPSLITIASARPLPAVVIAQRQYGDAGRADELIIQADPVHPWFMPTAFQGLAQ